MFWNSQTSEIISLILKNNEQNLGQWNFSASLSVVHKNSHEWMKKIRLPLPLPRQSSLQQSHLVYCSATALPATTLLHTLLEVLIFFCFFLHEGRYVETPGHSGGHRGAVYLIPALARSYTTGVRLPNLQTPARSACSSVHCNLWKTTGLRGWP